MWGSDGGDIPRKSQKSWKFVLREPIRERTKTRLSKKVERRERNGLALHIPFKLNHKGEGTWDMIENNLGVYEMCTG